MQLLMSYPVWRELTGLAFSAETRAPLGRRGDTRATVTFDVSQAELAAIRDMSSQLSPVLRKQFQADLRRSTMTHNPHRRRIPQPPGVPFPIGKVYAADYVRALERHDEDDQGSGPRSSGHPGMRGNPKKKKSLSKVKLDPGRASFLPSDQEVYQTVSVYVQMPEPGMESAVPGLDLERSIREGADDPMYKFEKNLAKAMGTTMGGAGYVRARSGIGGGREFDFDFHDEQKATMAAHAAERHLRSLMLEPQQYLIRLEFSSPSAHAFRGIQTVEILRFGEADYGPPAPKGSRGNPGMRRNPEVDERQLKAAIKSYEGFHLKDHKGVQKFGNSGAKVPETLKFAGPCKWVTYRSDKWHDGTNDYVHDVDSFPHVKCAVPSSLAPDGCPDIKIPQRVQDAEVVAAIGLKALGFAIVDADGEEWEAKLNGSARWFWSPQAKALYCIDGTKLQCVIWGGSLNVEPRGIVG